MNSNTVTLENAPDVLTVKELKQILGIGTVNAYRLLQAPGFPAVKVTSRTYRISKAGLIRWLEQGGLKK